MTGRGVTGTPGRTTRARSATPLQRDLPAVNTRANHAYGAAGRAELREQVRATSSDFVGDFEQGRKKSNRAASQTASARTGGDDEEDEPVVEQPSPKKKTMPPQRTSTKARGPTATGGEAAAMAGVDDPALSGRPDTTVEGGAEYGGVAAGFGAEMRRQVGRPNSLMWILLALFLALFSGLLLGVAPLPKSMAAARQALRWRTQIFVGVQHLDLPPSAYELRWQQYKSDALFGNLPEYNMPDMQWAINMALKYRLQDLETRVATVESALRLTNETLEEMEKMLPGLVVVREEDDQIKIPEDFWAALQERLVEDGDLAPLWESYLLRNQEQIKEIHDKYDAATFDAAVEKRRIVTVETFRKTLQVNNDWLATRYKEEFSELWRMMNQRAEIIAVSAAHELFEKSPASAYARDQLDVLVKANMIHNAYEAVHSYNYFSPGSGARVYKPLTSKPQPNDQRNWLASFYHAVSPMVRGPNTAMEALTKWDEAYECFCGRHDKEGSTQIAVSMNEEIYPDRLVIEHVPESGTKHIKAAPKDFEVWAYVKTPEEATRFNELMDRRAPFHHCQKSPGPKWVCIGQNQYNINQHNHVQAFDMRVVTDTMGLSTRHIVVVATTNWGEKYTCFYRLRMLGSRVE